jgi:hypothetical protein
VQDSALEIAKGRFTQELDAFYSGIQGLENTSCFLRWLKDWSDRFIGQKCN